MKRQLIFTLVILALCIIVPQAKAEMIVANDGIGFGTGTASTSVDVLLLKNTSGLPVTGLTKANFKFIGASDIGSNTKRAIAFTVTPLTISGLYRITITPAGWSYYNFVTRTGNSPGIYVKFKIEAGSHNGPLLVGISSLNLNALLP